MTIYFYKVNDPYGCFSNFSPHWVQLQAQCWSTTEHYYQAQKFVGTQYEFLYSAIQKAQSPEEAAALGRDPKHRVRLDWPQVKQQVMREAVLTKFLTHSDIQAVLLSTQDEFIVEDSPKDDFWGCGANRMGQNQLGKILMSVRQEIRLLHCKAHQQRFLS